MAYSDAQRKATLKWRKENIKRVTIELNKIADIDIIEKLESVKSKSSYLKDLVRKDLVVEVDGVLKRKYTLNQLEKLEWEKAVIVFDKCSWDKEYPLLSRSYEIYHDANYFDNEKMGNSLYANCLDGTDKCLRLNDFLLDWEIEYCYIVE